MVTTNQKSIIDTHTHKRKESKYNIKIVINHKVTEQKKKTGPKKNYKTSQKQLTKWQ